MSKFIPPWLTTKSVRYGLIGIFAIISLVSVIFLGIYANLKVTGANDEHMPGIPNPETTHDPDLYIALEGANLAFLGDIYPMQIKADSPTWYGHTYHRTVDFLTGNDGPGSYYYSIGDLLIWIGRTPLAPAAFVFAIVVAVMIRRAKSNGQVLFPWPSFGPSTPKAARLAVTATVGTSLLGLEMYLIYIYWYLR